MKETGGPAFPQPYEHVNDLYETHMSRKISDDEFREIAALLKGMTLRQYAAIKLRVPDSGTDWLDEMITKSLRDESAGKAMQALITHMGCDPDVKHHFKDENKHEISRSAYKYSDAMLQERNK